MEAQHGPVDFEPGVTEQPAQAMARIFEVQISYSGRTYAEGKKVQRAGRIAFCHITGASLRQL